MMLESQKEEAYLKAKESLRATILIGIVLEEATLNKDQERLLRETIEVLTAMNFEEYMKLRPKFEPESTGFDNGLRWIPEQ